MKLEPSASVSDKRIIGGSWSNVALRNGYLMNNERKELHTCKLTPTSQAVSFCVPSTVRSGECR